ncbi:hypothetical protein A0H81_00551 [Grifola frondosa]|uniref:Copper acquisition factor BIM1-like domain-containing protein n=1 Tax=Grifola frondosa TaxID=5627 RepID=A0A1C7MQY0_GRIFR|nr:hypothetical protein A0H81_00551 [Grifola frondosa]
MNNEPTFCDGYPSAVSNRTVFPASGGFISLNSEHPKWTLGVMISTVQDPISFDNFTSGGQFQYTTAFFQTTGEGAFCMPVDLTASGISGVKSGANVTIQLVFDGGDGQLYQCADLTLADVTIPSNISCTNATDSISTPVSTTIQPSSTSPSGTGSSTSSSASTTTTSNAASANSVVGLTGLLGVLGALAALL